jgi:RimJ/RimL family protein N-acetyltransferase
LDQGGQVNGNCGHITNIAGESVSLGPLRRDLVPLFQRWSNDLSTSRTLGLSWPTTLEQELSTYDQRANDPSAVYFTVYERSTEQPIGIAYLYEIDARHARASFGIMIGNAANRGKGYGTEATRLILDYAFNAFGLENVMLTVLSFNEAGIRAYENAGFKAFGRRRRCSRMGGRLWDLVYMECIAAEFETLS